MIKSENINYRNYDFRSWWRTISTRTINIDQVGIKIKTKNNKKEVIKNGEM